MICREEARIRMTIHLYSFIRWHTLQPFDMWRHWAESGPNNTFESGFIPSENANVCRIAWRQFGSLLLHQLCMDNSSKPLLTLMSLHVVRIVFNKTNSRQFAQFSKSQELYFKFIQLASRENPKPLLKPTRAGSLAAQPKPPAANPKLVPRTD